MGLPGLWNLWGIQQIAMCIVNVRNKCKLIQRRLFWTLRNHAPLSRLYYICKAKVTSLSRGNKFQIGIEVFSLLHSTFDFSWPNLWQQRQNSGTSWAENWFSLRIFGYTPLVLLFGSAKKLRPLKAMKDIPRSGKTAAQNRNLYAIEQKIASDFLFHQEFAKSPTRLTIKKEH